MRTNWTSSLKAALLVAALLAHPAVATAQVEDDEATTLVRPVDDDEATTLVRPVDDEEATTLVRPVDDEETTLIAPAESDEEDTLVQRAKPAGEGTTLVRKPVAKALPSSSPSFVTSRISGYLFEKWAFDTAHDGHGEDVFDLRSRFVLGAEINTADFMKVYISARFWHFAVGEDAGDESWTVLNSRNVKYEYEAEVQEAYVYLPNNVLNLRIGNQIVRWGYGQFNKPSDVLNPVDYREGLFSDLEVPLVPVFMVHGDRNVGPVNVSGVYIPFFTPNRTSLFGQDWAPLSAMGGNPAFATVGGMSQMSGMIGGLIPVGIEDDAQPLLLATHPPDEGLENGQFGTRLATRIADIDLSLVYFYGWDKLPHIKVDNQFLGDVGLLAGTMQEHPALLGVLKGLTALDPYNPVAAGFEMLGTLEALSSDDKAALEQAMQAINRILFDEAGNPRQLSLEEIFATRYRRQHTVGLSGSAILFDRVGLKLDSAFSPARTVYLESAAGFPVARSLPAISYSVGLDYRLGTWFDIMGEFYHFHVMDLEAGEKVFVIGSDLYMVTLASHIRLLDFEALEFQLAGMYEIAMQNLFLFPKVTYKFPNGIHVAAGAIVAEVLGDGDEMGPAGLFDRNDSVYAEFKWAF
jgi:hypothetical protein